MFKRRRSASLGLVSLFAVAVAVAGCGSSSTPNTSTTGTSTKGTSSSGASSGYGSSGPYGAAPAPAASNAAAGTAVDLGTSKLGKILVDSKGVTLYLFVADTGSSSTCSGACAGAWPPLTTKQKPVAGAGVKASLLGTTKRAGGTLEVTYAGHPLYYYAGDTGAGQTTGEALSQFGAPWYVVAPDGTAIK